ncbi:hypothetical protein SDC9_145625 [bioreactor metagenome]|uniref:Uncharacterized protein n=1 Tax=bioreactor metagenome TaxID=1076179 RepID=A0A645EAM9_9ZZZZ
MEDSDRVRTASHAGNHVVWLTPSHFRHLYQALLADHGLKIALHHRIRVWSGNRANDIKSVANIGHPVTHGFIEGILQGLGARLNRHHRRPQQLHAVDVGCLALDVLCAHVHHAFHPVARSHGRSRHPVLPGTGLGDHPRLAHPPSYQRLTDAVVNLVRTSVVQILSLQIDLRTTQQVRPPFGMIDRAGATDIMLEFVLELGHEGGIRHTLGVGRTQLIKRRNQRFSDENPAVRAEMPTIIRKLVLHVSHLHLELRQ